ncbi:MAG: tetratricopeptide repeat protein [Anaerolineae bacterium]
MAAPDCRLVTLTGPGGIGKTRLALQVAADQAGLHGHGLAFVPLAALDSADLAPGTMADAVAQAVGLQFHSQGDPEQQLLDFFREKEILLVLDNMEHILEGSDFLCRLLRHAPGVLLLVTSRERLSLREEQIYEVHGLPWPTATAMEGLESYDSVALFIQTARRAHRRFVLAPHDAPCVARICRLVEGLPLAVELAAAWIPVRTCQEIATQIENNLDILPTTLRNVPGRHRSLRAAFEHSWHLLSHQERKALGRLSQFQGAFEKEAAADIAAASAAILAALVVKSLLRRDAAGRYEMHRLLQQYAEEKLHAQPEEQRLVEERYCDYYGRFLQEREAWFRGARQADALETTGAGIENIRQAWRLAIARDRIEDLGRALTSLGMFYAIRCLNQEGAALFGRAAGHLGGNPAPGVQDGAQAGQRNVVLGQLLAWQGHFAYQLGHYAQAQEQLEKSLDLLRAHGAQHETAFSLYTLAHLLCHGQNDYAGAQELFLESLSLFRAADDGYGSAQSLDGLGDVAARLGSLDVAEKRFKEGLALRREIGDRWGIAISLSSLGGLAGRQGKYDEARRWFQESLAISRALGNPRGIAACLHNLSTIDYLQEDYVESRRKRLETLDICRQIGYRWGVASALKSLGDVARHLGKPEQAMRYLRESLALLQEDGDRRGQAYTLNSLGTVAQGMGQRQAARGYFRQALEASLEIREPALAVDTVMSLAALVADDGDVEGALTLLSFVVHHPACEQQTRDQAEPLRADLAGRLPTDVARQAEARGRDLEMEQVSGWVLGHESS